MAAREWGRLVDHLNEWSTASVTPDGIEVTFDQPDGGPRRVELVVTPDDWSEYWGVIWGDEDSAAAHLRDLLLTHVPTDKPVLVYDREQWEASATREFPLDPDEDVDRKYGGHWVARDREGNVVSRYADWIDPH